MASVSTKLSSVPDLSIFFSQTEQARCSVVVTKQHTVEPYLSNNPHLVLVSICTGCVMHFLLVVILYWVFILKSLRGCVFAHQCHIQASYLEFFSCILQ